MPQRAVYEPGAYNTKPAEEIKADLETKGYRPLLIDEKPNDSLPAHQHSSSHILVQVAGEMRINTGGKEINMKPGDKLTIPPNVEHGAEFGENGSQYLWVEY